MSKVQFGSDVGNVGAIVELREQLKAEKLRADNALRRVRRIKSRVTAFYEAVDFVSFADATTAPPWAENWFNWLRDGASPANNPAPADEPVVVKEPETPGPATPVPTDAA